MKSVNENIAQELILSLQKIRIGITNLGEALKDMGEREVLKGADESALPPYLADPEVEEYADGDDIITEGNWDRDFFRLERGKLAVFLKGNKIAMITEPGEFFGEMAALLHIPRTATVRALGRCRIQRFPGDKLDEIIEEYPDMAKEFFRLLSERLRNVDQVLVNVGDLYGQTCRQLTELQAAQQNH